MVRRIERVVFPTEPEADGDLRAVEVLAGKGDPAVHEVGLDEGAVVDEVLHPVKVGILLRQAAKLPAHVFVLPEPVGVVEERTVMLTRRPSLTIPPVLCPDCRVTSCSHHELRDHRAVIGRRVRRGGDRRARRGTGQAVEVVQAASFDPGALERRLERVGDPQAVDLMALDAVSVDSSVPGLVRELECQHVVEPRQL